MLHCKIKTEKTGEVTNESFLLHFCCSSWCVPVKKKKKRFNLCAKMVFLQMLGLETALMQYCKVWLRGVTVRG